MSECIKCGSYDTELYEANDGHFRKKCNSCGYIGGPYISSNTAASSPSGQASLSEFGGNS